LHLGHYCHFFFFLGISFVIVPWNQ
jgi:hypothetical protein